MSRSDLGIPVVIAPDGETYRVRRGTLRDVVRQVTDRHPGSLAMLGWLRLPEGYLPGGSLDNEPPHEP